jgi:hypothetical protein
MTSSAMLHRLALARADVSEEISRVRRFLVTASLVPSSRRRYVPPKRRFLREPHGVISKKTPFFTVDIVPDI